MVNITKSSGLVKEQIMVLLLATAIVVALSFHSCIGDCESTDSLTNNTITPTNDKSFTLHFMFSRIKLTTALTELQNFVPNPQRPLSQDAWEELAGQTS